MKFRVWLKRGKLNWGSSFNLQTTEEKPEPGIFRSFTELMLMAAAKMPLVVLEKGT